MNHSPQGGAPDGASQPPTMTLTDHLHHDGIDVLIDPPAQLRQWFANSERIFRRPFWKDLVTSSAQRPAPRFSEHATTKASLASGTADGTVAEPMEFARQELAVVLMLMSRDGVPAMLSDVALVRQLVSFLKQRSSTRNAAIEHEKMLRSASSAVQPASHSTAPQLTSALPCELLLLIVQYTGAHNLEAIWECSECKPHWHNWYCYECELTGKYLYWSHKWHFGYCGLTCGCCRSAKHGVGCETCEELWKLKGTCQTMRDLLKTYDGT